MRETWNCDGCGAEMKMTPHGSVRVREEELRARVSDLEESLREDVGGVVRTNLAQRSRIQELEAERADVEGMAKEMTKARARVAQLEAALRDICDPEAGPMWMRERAREALAVLSPSPPDAKSDG